MPKLELQITGITNEGWKMTYTFHSDPGHGWLEVPIKDLEVLGIKNKISSFSYYSASKGIAYLEEDCDASYFIFSMEKVGKKVEYKEVYHKHFNRNRPSYPFNSEYDYEKQRLEQYEVRIAKGN